MAEYLQKIIQDDGMFDTELKYWKSTLFAFVYCVSYPVRVGENRQFLSTWMEFSKNVYTYSTKVPSRN